MKRVARALAVLALLAGLSAACGDDDTAEDEQTQDSTETAAASTAPAATAPASGPRAGATYGGSIEGAPGLAGQVTLVVADSGEEIAELMLELDMEGYACGSSTMSGGLGLGIRGPVAIVDDTFEVDDGSTMWEGRFETEQQATGTVAGSLPVMGGSPCEFGPFGWTAEPGESDADTSAASEAGVPDTTAASAPASAELEAMFVDELLAYPAMESVVPGEQLSCASGLAAQRLSAEQIDELDQPSPSPEVMSEVGVIVEECFEVEIVLALLAVGFRDGGGLAQSDADCVVSGLADLSMSDFGVLLSIEGSEQLPPELNDRVFEAIESCFP